MSSVPNSIPNDAVKRANHNAIERARREILNYKFHELAQHIPSLKSTRKPSKSVIVQKALEFIVESRTKSMQYEILFHKLKTKNQKLRAQLNPLLKVMGEPLVSDDENETFSLESCIVPLAKTMSVPNPIMSPLYSNDILLDDDEEDDETTRQTSPHVESMSDISKVLANDERLFKIDEIDPNGTFGMHQDVFSMQIDPSQTKHSVQSNLSIQLSLQNQYQLNLSNQHQLNLSNQPHLARHINSPHLNQFNINSPLDPPHFDALTLGDSSPFTSNMNLNLDPFNRPGFMDPNHHPLSMSQPTTRSNLQDMSFLHLDLSCISNNIPATPVNTPVNPHMPSMNSQLLPFGNMFDVYQSNQMSFSLNDSFLSDQYSNSNR